jgi:hypothetical protein
MAASLILATGPNPVLEFLPKTNEAPTKAAASWQLIRTSQLVQKAGRQTIIGCEFSDGHTPLSRGGFVLAGQRFRLWVCPRYKVGYIAADAAASKAAPTLPPWKYEK